MASTSGVVTLTTDFGRLDGYVGVMHGVVLRVHPAARIVDLVHDVPPQDVLAAAFHLRHAWRHFAPGTVHVIVVDPGVGTDRRILVREHGGQLFLAPDNGLLEWALGAASGGDGWQGSLDLERLGREVELNEVSRTFHGRDLFAPAGALLAAGVPSKRLAAELSGPPLPAPDGFDAYAGDELRAHEARVVHVDRFGNAITTWTPGPSFEPTRWRAFVAGRRIPCVGTYGDVTSGDPLALLDSFGHVEVAVRGGDAAGRLGLRVGDPVRFEPED